MDKLEKEGKVTYDKDYEELVVRAKKRKIDGKFSAIGKLTKDGQKQKDIFDLLDQVGKGAYSLFTELKRLRNENNNLVEYSTKDWSKSDREKFSRQLKELRKNNIVRVAKKRMYGQDPQRPYVSERQTYMINPDLLKCWEYEDAYHLWSQCKP
jgi:hypothetical protein